VKKPKKKKSVLKGKPLGDEDIWVVQPDGSLKKV
jgi:hypothetical protein